MTPATAWLPPMKPALKAPVQANAGDPHRPDYGAVGQPPGGPLSANGTVWRLTGWGLFLFPGIAVVAGHAYQPVGQELSCPESAFLKIEADQQRVAVQRFYGHVACVEFLNIAFVVAARLRKEFAAPVLVHVERDEIEAGRDVAQRTGHPERMPVQVGVEGRVDGVGVIAVRLRSEERRV